MMANGNAVLSAFDAVGGKTELASGTMEKADTSAYNAARITGDYAFGVSGLDHSNNRVALRVASLQRCGSFSNATADINSSGTINSAMFTMATYSLSDSLTGRAQFA